MPIKKKRLIILTSNHPFYSMDVIDKILNNNECLTKYKIEIWSNKNQQQPTQKILTLFKQIKKSGFRYVISKIKYIQTYKIKSKQDPNKYKIRSHFKQDNYYEFETIYDIPLPNKNDILLSLYYNSIIPNDFLNKFKVKINLHPSLIPSYKGASPVFWVLANNEQITGFTFHELTKKIDCGEVLFQKEIKIDNNDTFHSLYKKISEHAGVSLSHFLIKGYFPEFPSNNHHESYYSIPTKKAYLTFIKNGKRFI